MEDNNIKKLTFQFAVKIITLYKKLVNEKKEYVISKQILRSGTSIGANYREADNAISKADFIFKLSISQKEADETLYWLELLLETEFIDKNYYDELHQEGEAILKIIKTIIINTKRNMKNK